MVSVNDYREIYFQVEVKALPLMVDCRPAGAPPHDMPHNNGTGDNSHQVTTETSSLLYMMEPPPAGAEAPDTNDGSLLMTDTHNQVL